MYENTFEASFNLILVGASDLDATITAKHWSDLSCKIQPKCAAQSELNCRIVARQVVSTDLNLIIHPYAVYERPAVIRVNAGAYMEGDFETTDPPRIIDSYSAIKDAFIWKALFNMNFGAQSEMLLGADGEDQYRAYLSFPVPVIPSYGVITKVTLKVYTITPTIPGPISIRSMHETFDEYGLAWENTPDITNSTYLTTVNWLPKVGYHTVDLTSSFKNISTRKSIDLILSIDDPEYQRTMHLGTRESKYAPILEVEYLDPRIFNPGIMKLNTRITARRSDEITLPMTLQVNSKNMISDLLCKLEVPEYSTSMDLSAVIIASQGNTKDLYAVINVPSYDDYSEMSAKILAISKGLIDKNVTLTVPVYEGSKQLDVKINIPEYSSGHELSVTLRVRQATFSDKNVMISTIPTYQFDKDCILKVPQYQYRKDLSCIIGVPLYISGVNLRSTIAVVGKSSTNLGLRIEVSQPHAFDKDLRITVPSYNSECDKPATIFVPLHGWSEKECIVTIEAKEGSTDLSCTLLPNVLGSTEFNIQITVPEYEATTETPVKIKVVERVAFERDAVIIIRVDDFTELPISITKPYEAYTDFNLRIQCRVMRVRDLVCTIKVAGEVELGYAFIL